MNIPSDLKYTKDHEWVRIEGNIATIGITDFAQGELGDIVFVDSSGLTRFIGLTLVYALSNDNWIQIIDDGLVVSQGDCRVFDPY